VQDPEIWLNELGVTVACPVRTDRDAVLAADHRIFVNWETYYVSSAEALADFLESPHEFTGKLTDPVTRMRFEPGGRSPRQDHAGRIFYFGSRESAATFAARPDSFATPVITMRGN
jgi:YHS domain-containing protein